MECRARYHYFREKLSKELSLQPGGIQASISSGPVNIGRFDLTRTSQPPANQSPTIQTQYPGAASAGTPYGYQATASYPGASTVVSYPGTQTTSYPGVNTSQTPFVFNYQFINLY